MTTREQLQASLDGAYENLARAQALVDSLIDRLTDLDIEDDIEDEEDRYADKPWGEQQSQIDYLESRYDTEIPPLGMTDDDDY